MIKAYLFDWGDTIMKDFPDQTGPMYAWDKVESMSHADEMLQLLSAKSDCYLATNAKDSTKDDILKALKRVKLDKYFKDIFCYRELGVAKPSLKYFNLILSKLNLRKEEIVMVGDNIESDIREVQKHGIDAILYDPQDRHKDYRGKRITDLIQLLD